MTLDFKPTNHSYYCSTTRWDQHSDETQRWMMEKQNAAHADTGIPPNLKKEGNCAAYSIMDEPRGH